MYMIDKVYEKYVKIQYMKVQYMKIQYMKIQYMKIQYMKVQYMKIIGKYREVQDENIGKYNMTV